MSETHDIAIHRALQAWFPKEVPKDPVVLFSLKCLYVLLFEESNIFGTSQRPTFLKIVPSDNVHFEDGDYQRAALLLKQSGIQIAKVTWKTMFVGDEPSYVYRYIYRDDLEGILKYEYNRDLADYYKAHLDMIYG